MSATQAPDPQIIEIDYTNWEGIRRIRKVKPLNIVFMDYPPYHKEAQWILIAIDVEKNQPRHFATANIHGPWLHKIAGIKSPNSE